MIIPATPLPGPTFPKCGHPRTDENTRLDNGGCCFCTRVKRMAAVVEERMARLNAGPQTVGQKIAAGLL